MPPPPPPPPPKVPMPSGPTIPKAPVSSSSAPKPPTGGPAAPKPPTGGPAVPKPPMPASSSGGKGLAAPAVPAAPSPTKVTTSTLPGKSAPPPPPAPKVPMPSGPTIPKPPAPPAAPAPAPAKAAAAVPKAPAAPAPKVPMPSGPAIPKPPAPSSAPVPKPPAPVSAPAPPKPSPAAPSPPKTTTASIPVPKAPPAPAPAPAPPKPPVAAPSPSKTVSAPPPSPAPAPAPAKPPQKVPMPSGPAVPKPAQKVPMPSGTTVPKVVPKVAAPAPVPEPPKEEPKAPEPPKPVEPPKEPETKPIDPPAPKQEEPAKPAVQTSPAVVEEAKPEKPVDVPKPKPVSALGNLTASSSTNSATNSSASVTKKKASDVKKPLMSVDVYQLGDCIGKGAFGTVYRGLNSKTGEVVALKQFDMERLSSDDLESLVTEIKILRELDHPNIVRYIDIIKAEKRMFLVLEYVEQGSLLSIVKQFGSLPENLIAVYIDQTLRGLAYLHSKNVAHCDIKCANILSTKRGEMKLTDFGVSRTLAKAEGNLAPEAVGTPYWMAPEIIELKGVTPAADIWSLGATVIELLTGKPPYIELNAMSALFRIVQDDMPPLPECSDECVDFLKQCFRKEPAERPAAEALLRHAFIMKHRSGAQASASEIKKMDEKELLDLPSLLKGAKKEAREKKKALGSKSNVGTKSATANSLVGTAESDLPASSALPPASSANENASSLAPKKTDGDDKDVTLSAEDKANMFKPKPFAVIATEDDADLINVLKKRGYAFGSGVPELDTVTKPTKKDIQVVFQLVDVEKEGMVSLDDAKMIVRSYGYVVLESNMNEIISKLGYSGKVNLDQVVALHDKVAELPKINADAILKAFNAFNFSAKEPVIKSNYLRKAVASAMDKLNESELKNIWEDPSMIAADGKVTQTNFVKSIPLKS